MLVLFSLSLYQCDDAILATIVALSMPHHHDGASHCRPGSHFPSLSLPYDHLAVPSVGRHGGRLHRHDDHRRQQPGRWGHGRAALPPAARQPGVSHAGWVMGWMDGLIGCYHWCMNLWQVGELAGCLKRLMGWML